MTENATYCDKHVSSWKCIFFVVHPPYPMFTLSVLCICLSSHHDDYAVALLCLQLSTYSAASSSSLRNFLTPKFLTEEFIKIAYSPPSSRRNALSNLQQGPAIVKLDSTKLGETNTRQPPVCKARR